MASEAAGGGVRHGARPVQELQRIPPFSELDEHELRELQAVCRYREYPAGSSLAAAGTTLFSELLILCRGTVSGLLVDNQAAVVYRREYPPGSLLGVFDLIEDQPSSFELEARSDCSCLLLPRARFLDLLAGSPAVSRFLAEAGARELVRGAYARLRQDSGSENPCNPLPLFASTAGEAIVREPVAVRTTETIRAAAALMSERRIGSLLIHQPEDPERIVGIVTDRDLRLKVVSSGLSYDRPVAEIMSTPLRSVSSETLCFEVLLRMMSGAIHHLGVERGNRVVGVVTSNDLIALQSNSPIYLFQEISRQDRIQDLYPLALKIPRIISCMVRQGGRASHVSRLLAVMNDQVLRRLLRLLEGELGAPPVPFCWLLLGSEGRSEQTLKTDQDNAIVYQDPTDRIQADEAQRYFAEFAERATAHLERCGYQLCPGNTMASNPQWCQPFSVWRGYFESWMAAPDPQEIINASIFFDFRSGYGREELAQELRRGLVEGVEHQQIFLYHLARYQVASGVPLSFFGSFVVERDGEHRRKLDLKTNGIARITDFARLLALKHGLPDTNTLARLHLLRQEGYLAEDVHRAAEQGYEFLMQLRLMHQLERLERGMPADNYVDPAALTDSERRQLKEVFRVIERLRSIVDMMYRAS